MRIIHHHHGRRGTRALSAWFMAIVLFAVPLSALGQTQIKAPSNKYSIRDDIQAGQQAAREVEQQMPILNDRAVEDYIENVGQRLVAAIPSEHQHPEFRYSFKVVNARDINAFALPGGPMYVNRGMIEAARGEGEMAGVMAHEIAHVALRHGTAQATKAQKYQLPALGGAILGAIIGGGLGSVISQGSQMAVGTYFLKFSREYETQADILGAQIMARAGYDPRDLANMFRTIEQQGGGRGGPEWMSSHPNPGNRYQRIQQEAAMLRVQPSNAIQDTRQFQQVQARLRGGGRAPSMEEIARSGQRQQQRYPQDDGRYPQQGGRGRVEYPSARYRTYSGGNLFRISVPENWREFGGNNSVTYAPEGAYNEYQGQGDFTHGVMVGIANAQTNNLRQATDAYMNSLLQGNPNLRPQSRNYQRGSVGGRQALAMTLAGRSNTTGQTEYVTVYTTLLRDGNLFYMISISPEYDYRNYQGVFQQIVRSVQLNDSY